MYRVSVRVGNCKSDVVNLVYTLEQANDIVRANLKGLMHALDCSLPELIRFLDDINTKYYIEKSVPQSGVFCLSS